ncbi:MAG: rRNA (guanosine2251-2-O)-methyltransferase [Solirubrobacteraceae bacterium]|nr:rRNA (guanosine2251-2-O)-methyltransferase [Solirubrobacteraceae bacterium]
MILYGRNPVHEALRAGRRPIETVWATVRAAREPWLREVPDMQIVSSDEVARRCGSPDHQGICAQVGGYPYIGAAELLATRDPFVVALDELQDPQNLGAICRSAECAGATGVVICDRRAAAVTPAVAKASAGAVEHLRIARVRNLADFLAQAKAAGCWCYGADGSSPLAYDQPDYGGGVVLVLGGEGSGLRPRVAQACDALIALPLRGRVQSLNASAAAAVLMYGIVQRRRPA